MRRRFLLALRDDPKVQRALEIWQQVAFAGRETPRELKRFLNQVRFAATAFEAGSAVAARLKVAELDEAGMVMCGALAHCAPGYVEGLMALEEVVNDTAVFQVGWKLAESGALRRDTTPTMDPLTLIGGAMKVHGETFAGSLPLQKSAMKVFVDLWPGQRGEA